MKSGDSEIDQMIARIQAIPGMARRAAPDVADAVRVELERTIAAGTTPSGETWAPRKADGGRPLEGAEKALAVAPVGTRIYMRLAGHIARHHLGRARGGTYRRILPTEGIPAPLARAIKRVLTEHFRDTVGGA